MSVIAMNGSVRMATALGQSAGAATAPKSSTRLRLTARGRRVFGVMIAIPALFGLGALGLWSTAAVAGSEAPATLTYVTVYSGDTLWSIAAAATDDSGDVRDTMTEIMNLNGLTSSALTPGQQIALPADN